jgi:hypothetical protein
MADEEQMALTEDGQRALREAEMFCYNANVAILAAEHLLAGALFCAKGEVPGLPSHDELASALLAAHGSGSEALKEKVMWGSSARDALNSTVGALREAGQMQVSARMIAKGIIESGEIGPMFFMSLGASKADLVAKL